MANVMVPYFLLTVLAVVTSSKTESNGYVMMKNFDAEYKFHGPAKYLSVAIATCLSEKSEIFYPKSKKQAKVVYDKIVPKNVKNITIGIYRTNDVKSYKSIHGFKDFFIGLDNLNTNKHYAILDFDMKLHAVYYPENLYFICERKIDECPSNKNDASYSIMSFNSTYKYFEKAGYWRRYKLYECLNNNAELFYPMTKDEGKFVFEKFVPKEVNEIAVGIHNWLNNSKYRTIDGNNEFFHDWERGDPKYNNHYLTVLSRKLKYRTTKANITSFICVKRTQSSPEKSCSPDVLYNTWYEAVKDCDMRNTTLAMPSTQSEVFRISDYFKNKCSGFKGIWLGFHGVMGFDNYANLTDDVIEFDKYQWVDEESRCLERGCGVVTSTGFLSVQDCNFKKPYLCQMDIDFVDYPDLRKSYKFSWSSLSWYEARKFCQEIGAKLAMPMNMAETKIMKFRDPIFVGFHSLFSKNTNVILKYSKPVPNNLKWKDTNRDETKLCGALDSDGLYKENCNAKHYFYCEKDYSLDQNHDMSMLSKNLMHYHWIVSHTSKNDKK